MVSYNYGEFDDEALLRSLLLATKLQERNYRKGDNVKWGEERERIKEEILHRMKIGRK